MTLSGADLKRQIIEQSGNLGIRKKVAEGKMPEGLTEDDLIQIGNALENLTKQKGWTYIEAYILRVSNLVGSLFAKEGEDSKIQKGIAKGLIQLLMYVDQHIKIRDDLIEKQNPKGES